GQRVRRAVSTGRAWTMSPRALGLRRATREGSSRCRGGIPLPRRAGPVVGAGLQPARPAQVENLCPPEGPFAGVSHTPPADATSPAGEAASGGGGPPPVSLPLRVDRTPPPA